MSWSQAREDGRDQLTILIGSAIRLLSGEAGVFVVSNKAYDPLSGDEYIPYRLSEDGCAHLLAYTRGREQPDMARPLLVGLLPMVLVSGLGLQDVPLEEPGACPLEYCSLLVYDQAGICGQLYYLRLSGRQSCFEQVGDGGGENATLPLFIAHVAAGIRSAMKAQLLLKEQNRLSAVIQQSAEGILTVDTALRIVDFNPAMERLTGWLESEVLGRYYYEVLLPQDRHGKALGAQDSLILQAFASEGNVRREMTIAARDGQRFDVAVTASSVRSSKDEAIGGILTVRDITREREEEERRSTFISVISHELQTPIAIIKGYASTLTRAALGDAQLDPDMLRSRLQAVEEEADRLNKLVSNLLYASRIQAGGLQMDIAPLDLFSLVQTVAMRLRVKSPDVTVRLDLAPNLPTVVADRDRIEEVLQNLLDNAVKYSPRQRVITVSARATSDEVIVSISDRGMGISVRDQEEIFERFQRVGGSQVRSTPGAGLGLYICRAIVEAHGGRIWVESVLHQGSIFSFSLPREEKARLPMVVF
ncbi:MAG TPA: ATP-binding protein [Ktedonobacteraceae bacterium]|nr:ATP-binding protein [Ktedonobacteraceae bacterium]